jgi:hypothetical protein
VVAVVGAGGRVPGRVARIPDEGMRAGTAETAGLPGYPARRAVHPWSGLVLGPEAMLMGSGPAILAVRRAKLPRPGDGRPGRQRGVRRDRYDLRLTRHRRNILIQAGRLADLVLF